MKKNIIRISVLLIFIIVVWKNTPSFKEDDCARQDDFNKLKFRGKVIKKYLDPTQHSVPVIEYKADSVYKIGFSGELNGIYDSVVIGDSVMKQYNNNCIIIYHHKDFRTETIKADFGCSK